MLQALSTVTLHQFKPTLSPCVPKCCAVLSSMIHPLVSLLFRIWFMLDLNTEKSHTICTARPVANKVPYSIQLLLCGKYGYARMVFHSLPMEATLLNLWDKKKLGRKYTHLTINSTIYLIKFIKSASSSSSVARLHL